MRQVALLSLTAFMRAQTRSKIFYRMYSAIPGYAAVVQLFPARQSKNAPT